MSSCFAYGCNHRSLREGCSFYRFPKDKNTFKLWRALCRRQDAEPKWVSSRLCSCHFKDKLKTNGPTIFPWTTGHFDIRSPEKSQREEVWDQTKSPAETTSEQVDPGNEPNQFSYWGTAVPPVDPSIEIKEEPVWDRDESYLETPQTKKIKLEDDVFDKDKEIKEEPNLEDDDPGYTVYLEEVVNKVNSRNENQWFDPDLNIRFKPTQRQSEGDNLPIDSTSTFSYSLLARSKENTWLSENPDLIETKKTKKNGKPNQNAPKGKERYTEELNNDDMSENPDMMKTNKTKENCENNQNAPKGKKRNSKELNSDMSELLKIYQLKINILEDKNRKMFRINQNFLERVSRLIKDFTLYQLFNDNNCECVIKANETLHENIQKYNLREIVHEKNQVDCKPITKNDFMDFRIRMLKTKGQNTNQMLNTNKNTQSEIVGGDSINKVIPKTVGKRNTSENDMNNVIVQIIQSGEKVAVQKCITAVDKRIQPKVASQETNKHRIEFSDCPGKKQFSLLTNQDEDIRLNTGLKSRTSLNKLLALLNSYLNLFNVVQFMKDNEIPDKLSNEEQILITLLKLKLNLTNLDLANKWDIDAKVVPLIVQFWLKILNYAVFNQKRVYDVFINKNCNRLVYAKTIKVVKEVENCTKILKSIIGLTDTGLHWMITDLYPLKVSDLEIMCQDQTIRNTIFRQKLVVVHDNFTLGQFVRTINNKSQHCLFFHRSRNKLNNDMQTSTRNNISNFTTYKNDVDIINKPEGSSTANISENEIIVMSEVSKNITTGEKVNKIVNMMDGPSSTTNNEIIVSDKKLEMEPITTESGTEHSYSISGIDKGKLKTTNDSVENMVNRIKSFKILEGVPTYLSNDTNLVWTTCASLCNSF